MGKKKEQTKEEEVKTLSEVEEQLIEKDEELVSDENITSMEAPEEPMDAEEIKEAFEKTEMPEEGIDDGLEHITPEEVQETVIEPLKEVLDEAKEIQEEKTELIDSLKSSEPEEAIKEVNKQINKVEEFKKKLQESFKNKTNSQIIHSWNGASYPF
jgi:hypothetical protein